MTNRTPKSLLCIAGRPFIFHQLELLKDQGIDRVVLCIGHLGDQVKAAVGDGRSLGLSVHYSSDGGFSGGAASGGAASGGAASGGAASGGAASGGGRLLGTGGAVKKALPLLGKRFFVLNGDTYPPCPFALIQSAYEAAGYPALMAVLRNDNRWDRSNVVFENGRLIEYDKHSRRSDMSHIDFGVSVLCADVFSPYGDSEVLDLSDMWRDLSRAGRLGAIEVFERFYEVGSRQGITDTEDYLSCRQIGA